MIDLRLFLAISNLWLFVVSSTRPKLKTFYVKKAALKRIRQYAGVVSWFNARADKVREDVTPLRRVSHVVFIRN